MDSETFMAAVKIDCQMKEIQAHIKNLREAWYKYSNGDLDSDEALLGFFKMLQEEASSFSGVFDIMQFIIAKYEQQYDELRKQWNEL